MLTLKDVQEGAWDKYRTHWDKLAHERPSCVILEWLLLRDWWKDAKDLLKTLEIGTQRHSQMAIEFLGTLQPSRDLMGKEASLPTAYVHEATC